jgi:hypothetical protein
LRHNGEYFTQDNNPCRFIIVLREPVHAVLELSAS